MSAQRARHLRLVTETATFSSVDHTPLHSDSSNLPSLLSAGIDSAVYLRQALDDWALWMESGGLRERTIKGRLEVVTLFARRVAVDPITADWRAIARFLNSLKRETGTRSTYRGALRAFYSWLVIDGQRTDNPVDRLPRDKPIRRKPRPIPNEALGRLLSIRMHRRTRMMILLAALQGMRVHEVAKVRGEDIYGGRITILGKGAHLASIPAHSLVESEAARLGFPREGYWFPSYEAYGDGRAAGPIAAKTVSKTISAAMQRAGVPGTPHALRHWYGTELMRRGADLRTVQELMRHLSITSTQLYTEVSDEHMVTAIERLSAPLHLKRAS